MRGGRVWVWLAVVAWLTALPASARPQDGAAPSRLVFGQSADLSGPLAAFGKGMRLGLQAALAEANRAGGVHGFELVLETLDDGGDPERALRNARELVERRSVFALVGVVGTAVAAAVETVAAERGVPFVAPLTGAQFLRVARLRPHVVNVRASLYQEADAVARRLKEDLRIRRLGVLYRDDELGRAGLSGVRRAAVRHGLELVAEADYPPGGMAVRVPLLDLQLAAPGAVVSVGGYRGLAELVRWSGRVGFAPYFVGFSAVGGEALAGALGAAGAGVYVLQVVPFPRDEAVPVVAAYRRALGVVDKSAAPGFASLEGYLAGRLVAAVLRRAGPGVNRASFLAAVMGGGAVDLDGFMLSYGPVDNQGSDNVFLTVIDAGGTLRPALSMVRRYRAPARGGVFAPDVDGLGEAARPSGPEQGGFGSE